MNNQAIYIVIPAKDEAPRIGGVLSRIEVLGFQNVIIVNDGSSDDTAAIASSFKNATILNHRLNLGAGAATQTGIKYALKKGAEIIVTLDADHQHQPEDIYALIDTLKKENLDVVIGSRFLRPSNEIPFLRILYNKIGNFISYLFTGLMVSDSQSGMKAFHARFASQFELKSSGFEFCVEIIQHIRMAKAKWGEIPIKVTYTKETQEKGQNLKSGIMMMFRMVRTFW